MKLFKRILLQLTILIVAIELFSLVAIEFFDALNSYGANYPTYLDKIRGLKSEDQLHVADINEDFGVWHQSNRSFIHKSPCFTATYYFNSYGARDFNRNEISDKDRAIFIGDSFTEGIGVDSSKRFSNLIEKKAGIDCLNFGVSGDFGTTQWSILYQKLASKFAHKYLFIGLFPKNDFNDDDFSLAKKNYSNRYRPYYLPEKDTIVYYLPKLNESAWNPGNSNFLGTTNINIKAGKIFKDRNYSLGVLEKIIRQTYSVQLILRIVNAIRRKSMERTKFSYYYNFDDKNIAILENSLQRIIKTSKNNGIKKIVLFSIPYLGDFKIHKSKPGLSPLNKKLQKLTTEYQIQYIDLLEEMSKLGVNPSDLYFSCDGHFSEYGNKIASEILIRQLP